MYLELCWYDVKQLLFNVELESFDIELESFDIELESFDIELISFDIELESFDIELECYNLVLERFVVELGRGVFRSHLERRLPLHRLRALRVRHLHVLLVKVLLPPLQGHCGPLGPML
jgi:hypothetical protein